MLVICEDCAKKYNIDESRIKGNRARFTCNQCGHIIIVDKSDLTRSLVRGSRDEQALEKKPSVDLLKEMETPLTKEDSSSPELPAEQHAEKTADEPDKSVKRKRETSIPGYFFIAGIISFVLVNGGIAFILLQHYSNIPTKQMEQHSGMFMTAALVLLGTWAVSFVIFFIMGKVLAKKVNSLTSAVTRICQGEKEVNVNVKGPAELVNMASALCQIGKGSNR